MLELLSAANEEPLREGATRVLCNLHPALAGTQGHRRGSCRVLHSNPPPKSVGKWGPGDIVSVAPG